MAHAHKASNSRPGSCLIGRPLSLSVERWLGRSQADDHLFHVHVWFRSGCAVLQDWASYIHIYIYMISAQRPTRTPKIQVFADPTRNVREQCRRTQAAIVRAGLPRACKWLRLYQIWTVHCQMLWKCIDFGEEDEEQPLHRNTNENFIHLAHWSITSFASGITGKAYAHSAHWSITSFALDDHNGECDLRVRTEETKVSIGRQWSYKHAAFHKLQGMTSYLMSVSIGLCLLIVCTRLATVVASHPIASVPCHQLPTPSLHASLPEAMRVVRRWSCLGFCASWKHRWSLLSVLGCPIQIFSRQYKMFRRHGTDAGHANKFLRAEGGLFGPFNQACERYDIILQFIKRCSDLTTRYLDVILKHRGPRYNVRRS